MSVYQHILTEKEFVDKDNLTYPFEERGLQFGDGIYEVIRVYKGKYYLIEEHLDRLFRSAAAVKINVPYNREELSHQLDELLKRNKIDEDAKVYLQITRGSAPREHAFPLNTPANLYAYVQDLPRKINLMKEGVTAISQPDVRWDWCYIKSLNLLPNVIAKQEAEEKGSFEAVLHKDGEVTECSSSNVYLVKDGSVYTHPAKKNILHGCVRMRVEHFCKEKSIPFVEEAFRIEDFQHADEVFLSSSTAEVMPIIKVDNQVIGTGKPGPITRVIQQSYESDADISEARSLFKEPSA